MCTALVLAGAVPVHAESPSATANASEETRARARALMNEGYDLLEQGDARAALTRFETADQLMTVPTTGLAVAVAKVHLGRLVAARARLRAVADTTVPASAPPAFVRARDRAAALVQELDGRIPVLRIELRGELPTGARARVELDGQPSSIDALRAGVPLDPGHHAVALTTDGGTSRAEAVLVEGDRASVTLALPDKASSTPGPVLPATAASSPRLPLTIAGLVVTAAGATVGTAAGLVALSHRNAAASGCVDARCPPATYADINASQTWSTVSTVSFLAAAAGLVAAGSAWFFLPPARAAALSHAVHPWIGLGMAGIAGAL